VPDVTRGAELPRPRTFCRAEVFDLIPQGHADRCLPVPVLDGEVCSVLSQAIRKWFVYRLHCVMQWGIPIDVLRVYLRLAGYQQLGYFQLVVIDRVMKRGVSIYILGFYIRAGFDSHLGEAAVMARPQLRRISREH